MKCYFYQKELTRHEQQHCKVKQTLMIPYEAYKHIEYSNMNKYCSNCGVILPKWSTSHLCSICDYREWVNENERY